MRKILPFAAIAIAITTATPALASDKTDCGNAPREQWLSTDAIKAKGTELGYEVRRVKVEKGCYELYAIDKSGAKRELYFNPVTGDQVSRKDED